MIGQMIAKDVRLVLRDRGALISLFVLPLAFMLAVGAVFEPPGSARARTVAIWHAPGDPRGTAITGELARSPAFAIRAADSPDAVRRAVADTTAEAGLVIPGGSAPVELVIDLATPPAAREPLDAALSGGIARALGVPPPPIERRPPDRARPAALVSAFQIAVPANAVLFGFFLALTVATALAADRRTGAQRRLLAAPVSRTRALCASLVPYLVIGVLQLAFLFGVGVIVFRMRIGGSPAAFGALSLALVYCAVALGLLLASLGRTERQLGGFGAVALLIMGLIGGSMVPRVAMPPAMRLLGLCVPHGWALDGYHDVIVRDGTTLAEIAPNVLALLGFGTAFAALGIARFRREQA